MSQITSSFVIEGTKQELTANFDKLISTYKKLDYDPAFKYVERKVANGRILDILYGEDLLASWSILTDSGKNTEIVCQAYQIEKKVA